MSTTPTLYHLERSLVGERLVPVDDENVATHTGIDALRDARQESARQAATHMDAVRRLEMRLRDLEGQLARQQHRAEQADTLVAPQRREAEEHAASLRRLAAKDSLNNNFPVWDRRGGDTRGA